ncbi:hypothetical protein Tsubulata_046961 [Turnera subulata]|uniref:Uncharacterized protein n=1 Tax=Turnera subulata TaxID=218843 RepID=A0A9Q0JFC4_9ROSI|nr:hypothetical protein Tsubulata_046961 [Turnera subulata]
MRGYMCRFNFALSMCLMTSQPPAQPPLYSRYKARLFIYLYSCSNLYHPLAFFFFFFFLSQSMYEHSFPVPNLASSFSSLIKFDISNGKANLPRNLLYIADTKQGFLFIYTHAATCITH